MIIQVLIVFLMVTKTLTQSENLHDFDTNSVEDMEQKFPFPDLNEDGKVTYKELYEFKLKQVCAYLLI